MGVVDAQENPLSSIHQRKLWEVQKYLVMTNHIADFNGYFMSKKWFDQLSPNHKDLVKKAVADALTFTEKMSDAQEAKLMEDLKKNGMKVITPDVAAFSKKAAPAMERLKAKWAPWVYDESLKAVKK